MNVTVESDKHTETFLQAWAGNQDPLGLIKGGFSGASVKVVFGAASTPLAERTLTKTFLGTWWATNGEDYSS